MYSRDYIDMRIMYAFVKKILRELNSLRGNKSKL